MSTVNLTGPHQGEGMSSTNHQIRGLNTRNRQNGTEYSPFDDLAQEYDAWFDKEGSLIFPIEVEAFKSLLPTLPKPWLEIGVGSGRFAQALGIETGVDPSSKLLQMARRRGINVFLGRGEQELFDEGAFGTVFLIVTLCFVDSPLGVLKEAHRILMPNGRLVLGFVPKDSPWGELYQQKKEEGHRFYRYAKFYKCSEVARFTVRAGFMGERMVSTLLQRPGEVEHMEAPREGYDIEAGFTIIVAEKRAARLEK
jgi:SAM-dependent methyltransferase